MDNEIRLMQFSVGGGCDRPAGDYRLYNINGQAAI